MMEAPSWARRAARKLIDRVNRFGMLGETQAAEIIAHEATLAASPAPPQADDAGVGEDVVERAVEVMLPLESVDLDWRGQCTAIAGALAATGLFASTPSSTARTQAIEEAAQELDNAAYVEECADETAEGTRRGKPWRLAAARVRALQGQQGREE